MSAPSRPALVGRDDTLAVLGDALSRAAGGTPRVVLVSGETGVGKTRLVRELLRRERPIALAGACVPVAGAGLPFAPLTQALRQVARSSRGRHALDRSPELGRLLTGQPGSPDAEPEDGFQQLRLFQAVLDLLRRLGEERPVALVVDDVHWADRSTLDLMRFLATNLTDERALVVLTYRTDEVSEDSPLRTWLAELARLPRTVRVVLERLDPADTAALAAAWAGGAPDPVRLETIVARSAGNPLYVEHLVRHDGGELPETLHDLLRSRVSSLPEETRRALRAMAVFGRGVPLDVLAATVAASETDAEDLVRPAVETGVVAVGSDETLAFRHPALREVVAAQLLPSERRRLHRAAAEALTAAGPAAATSGELARHWHQAGELERALESALAAGAAAEAIYAFADALESYLRVVDLLDRVPHQVDRVACLRSAARAAGLLGDDAEAVRLLDEALRLAADDEVRVDLLIRLGSLHLLAGRLPPAEQALRAACTLTAGQTSLPAARALAVSALLAASWPMLDDAETLGAEALDLCARVGARREEGHAHNALGLAAAQRGRLGEAVDHLRQALTLAREVGDAEGQQFAYINLSHVLGMAGRYDEQIAVCREGIATLTAMGLVRQSGNVLMANAGESLLITGRLDEADAMLRAGLALHTRGIMAAPVLLRAGQLAMVRGDQVRAWDLVEQARLVVEAEEAPLSWRREVAQVAAEIELWAKRPSAALTVVEQALDLLAGSDEQAQCGTLVGLGLRALGDASETERDRASIDGRRAARGRLLAASPFRPDDPLPEDLLEAAVMLTTRAEQRRADGSPEAGAWVAAGEAWVAAGRPVQAAYARWREAEARLGRGVDADAIAALRRAYAEVVALGAHALMSEVELLATWYRVDLMPVEVEEAEDPADAYGLTAREREVLAGLADGRTNAEIARELVISVKTASVHVSNILRKLDVSGRQEAARIAHRHGLGRTAPPQVG
jgi:predicted ATPase/DNA-binding CsgD family transcriptional regulator